MRINRTTPLPRAPRGGKHASPAATLAALCALLAGCHHSSTAPAGPPVTFLAAVVPPVTGPYTDGSGNTLTLTSAVVSFRAIELVSVNDAAGHDCAMDATGTCAEFENGAASATLQLSGGVSEAQTGTATPPGMYTIVEPDVTGVHIVGVYDGRSFDVTIPVGKEPLLPLPYTLHLAAATRITLAVNIASWLSANNTLIDPVSLTAGSTAAAAAASRIAASFTVGGVQ